MVEVVGRVETVLFLTGKAPFAAAADAAGESDADELADVSCVWGDVGSEGDDARDTFVAADVGEFDVGDGGAFVGGGGALFGMEICWEICR